MAIKPKPAPIIWITGQPGSGKTTLGNALRSVFGKNVLLVDGDDLRRSLPPLGFDEASRRRNIERAQNIAAYLNGQGMMCIVTLVSPYRDQREEFKKNYPVLEVYLRCSTPRGREHFHVENYEPPLEPDVAFDTAEVGVEDEVRAVLGALPAATSRARLLGRGRTERGPGGLDSGA